MSSTNPILISVVIPTYNRANLVQATLKSILAQSYANFELIIVDDGSTDNTEQALQPFLSDKVFYYKKSNGERGAARNFGTHKAKGDYVNWFDSDDLMMPFHLEEAAMLLEKNGRPEVLAMAYESRTPEGRLVKTNTYPEDLNKALIAGNLISNSPVIVRRDIALENPYNEDRGLSGSEDYELWLRLAAKYRFLGSERVTVTYLIHDQRSVTTMTDPFKLIERFTKFITYTTGNTSVLAFLGNRKGFFVMKNYLLLALDLVLNNYRSMAFEYLGKAFASSPELLMQKTFYAFLKHFFKNLFKRGH